MRYLLINTAVSVSNIVLVENDQIVSKVESVNEKDLSAKIFFMIDQVFRDANCIPEDLDKIFVVNGPGSFTGIRIGLTIAKIMAWSLKIDLIPISCLELLASHMHLENQNVVSLIDAKRGFVYAGIYDSNLNAILSDQYIELNYLLEISSDLNPIAFVSLDNFSSILLEKPVFDYIKIIKKHEHDEVNSCHLVNPIYLKLTEAEEKRKSDVC